MNTKNRKRRSRCARAGAVVVEMAFAAPVLFLFFFLSLEFSRVHMIRQTISNAVYEGCRRGIVPGATADDCRTAAQVMLDTVSANSATVTIEPSVINEDTTEVTTSIEIPVNSNSWVTPLFFADKTLSGSMTMRRERFNTSSVP